MEDSSLIPLGVDLLAVAVGALLGASWALTESKRPLAITGVALIAIATGLGDGVRFVVAGSLGFLTRMASVWFGWHLPAVQGFELDRMRRHMPGRRQDNDD